MVTYDDDEGWVDQLAVAREHRGRGLYEHGGMRVRKTYHEYVKRI